MQLNDRELPSPCMDEPFSHCFVSNCSVSKNMQPKAKHEGNEMKITYCSLHWSPCSLRFSVQCGRKNRAQEPVLDEEVGASWRPLGD